MSAMPRHRPCTGQQDLFGELPPVLYCRGCGQRLHGEESRARGYGPLCWRVAQGRLERRTYCANCRRWVEPGAAGCDECGNGFETRTFRVRVKYFTTKRRKPRCRTTSDKR